MPRDLTLQEFADEIGRSATTLRVQIRNGKLKAKKVGPPGRDVWMVTRREADRYKAEHLRGGDQK